ncbi:hypothetical protein F5I97DRAFT_2580 [Phlebopus sp. FC_14]|nr:hypothetical protein F5I97DRAFT_2580 [Phlebopus sp. FC_14]
MTRMVILALALRRTSRFCVIAHRVNGKLCFAIFQGAIKRPARFINGHCDLIWHSSSSPATMYVSCNRRPVLAGVALLGHHSRHAISMTTTMNKDEQPILRRPSYVRANLPYLHTPSTRASHHLGGFTLDSRLLPDICLKRLPLQHVFSSSLENKQFTFAIPRQPCIVANGLEVIRHRTWVDGKV